MKNRHITIKNIRQKLFLFAKTTAAVILKHNFVQYYLICIIILNILQNLTIYVQIRFYF